MTTKFKDFLIETTLKQGMVFRTLDKEGDLAGKLLFAKKVKGTQITVKTEDGEEADTTLSILNVDPKSIRNYDPKKDTKFS